jgi:hypothetical protein
LFGEVLTGDVVNPANSKLFTICKEAKLLSKEKAELFHLIVALLLWIKIQA